MKRISNILFAGILVIMSILSTPMNAEAATTYRDDWYTRYVTATNITNDVVKVDRNTYGRTYIGVCSSSNSSYDSVTISGYSSSDSGATLKTTITTTVNKYKQQGDVQTFSATTTNTYARFNLKIACTSGTAINEGYVYWLDNN